ncbi:MAG TPA: VOC family protein, partial [Arenicellales bacterium]|nr:VOC family protein [Arenicellales bacterium]
MSDCKLDHLVVAAADLAAGREYIEDLLGVRTEAGGRHDAIGTHNQLLRLGDDQYLEIIAVDPDAPAPGKPRWFGLDDPALRESIQ